MLHKAAVSVASKFDTRKKLLSKTANC